MAAVEHISHEEKQQFLEELRSGKDPAAAAQAVHPSYTGSMFRRLTNEASHQYDPFFAADYLRARAEGRKLQPPRPQAGEPRTTTLSGHVKAKYLTEEMLDEFCEQVADGVPLAEAVEQLEPQTTLTQINRRAASDPEFARAYAQAKEVGYPAFQERLRQNIVRMASHGDYRAARDLAIIHLPEFRDAFLTRKTEIMGGTTNELRVLVQQVFPELADGDIEQLIGTVERRLLEEQVIDAE